MADDFLRKVALFSGLTDEEFTGLAALTRNREYKKGTFIVLAEDVGDEFFIIRKGWVKVNIVHEDGREVIFSMLGPGQVFGELALLTGDVRQATVRALGDTVCFSIARQDLFAITSEDIALGNKVLWGFLRQMGDKVKGLLGRLTELELSQSRQGP